MNNTKNETQLRMVFSVSLMAVVASVALLVRHASAASDTEQVTLQVTVDEAITLSVDSTTVNLGTLTPGTPVTASTAATVSTNANNGYHLDVKRDDSDTTMDHTSDATINITDKTAWDSSNPNAATWSGTGLGFSVYASTATKNTTWWGTGSACDDSNNLYAGFPSSYETIMNHSSYSPSSTTTSICYKLDVPTTQRSGNYDGTITYQAVTNP